MTEAATIPIPEFCLLLLVGPSGAGKSTFARARFAPEEILSLDAFRIMVSGTEEDMSATADASAVMHDVAARRLRRRLLSVVDATNLRAEDRAALVEVARRGYAPAVAIAFDVPEKTCLARNASRLTPRPPRVVKAQHSRMRGIARSLRREGFSHVHVIDGETAADGTVRRDRLWTDRRDEKGPFDIVGDVHGCLDELVALLGKLGYSTVRSTDADGGPSFAVSHPEGRRLVFLGDFGDRGPDTPGVLALVMDAVASGTAIAVKGNHDLKLLRHLNGREVAGTHGFAETAAAMSATPRGFADRVRAFLDKLTSHLVLDGGTLAVAHAGVKEEMQARGSRLVSDFCMFGETDGETDEYGLPVRHDWAASYSGKAAVVYGHTPVTEPRWVGNTACIDTGCVFGGTLTSLRWPGREFVSVPASAVHCAPSRPAKAPGSASPGSRLPDAARMVDKAFVQTRYGKPVAIGPERAAAAFEILATKAADPRWLVFIPPTTATVEASGLEGWLERPEDALDHYAAAGVSLVCIQEKHMGSRAVAVVCRDHATALSRFGDGDRLGAVLTRTGRPFLEDPTAEGDLVAEISASMTRAGMWELLGGDWVVLDGEILPWNAKAGELIEGTFAAAGCAGTESSRAIGAAFAAAVSRGVAGADALALAAGRRELAFSSFRKAYGAFVFPYSGPADLRFAPFHFMAAGSSVFAEKPHSWHMTMAARLSGVSPGGRVVHTGWIEIDPSSPGGRAAAVARWEEEIAAGREGVIVKGPCLAPRPGGLAPALKVRGREYLRIVYGAEYDRPDLLPGLRRRETGRKRTLARVGASLALEGLARLAEGASPARVHEAVAASLAVASEPVDARL